MGFWSWLFGKKSAPVIPIKPNPSPAQPQKPAENLRFSDNSGKFLINNKVLEINKHFEGLVLVAEDDGYGTPTIGYGRIINSDGSKVRNGQKCSEYEARAWLLDDLYREGAKYVRAYLKDDVENALSDDEFSVWVSLCFARGCGRFRESVAVYLNRGDKDGAVRALTGDTLYHFLNGNYSLGLHRRRWAERLVLEGKDWRAVDSVAKFKAFQARGYVL